MDRFFDNSNSIVVFSVARSGTHLVMQKLLDQGYKEWSPHVVDNGISHTFNPPKENYFVFAGHIQHTSYKEDFIKSGLNGIYVFRNPLDVIVSQAYFIKDKERNNPFHIIFQDKSYEDCMNIIIDGLPPIESIFEKYRDNKGWLLEQNVVGLRYEDLIKLERSGTGAYRFYYRNGKTGEWRDYKNVKWAKLSELVKEMGYTMEGN